MDQETNNKDTLSVRPKIVSVKTNCKDQKKLEYQSIEDQSMVIINEDGNKQMISALHSTFVHSFDVFNYPAYPFNCGIEKSQDWLAKVNQFESSLRILLKLPHHVFWSTVIYDRKINLGLRNYINSTNRFYKLNQIKDNSLLKVVNVVHELVFKILLRLSTVKESDKHFWIESSLGKTLYDKKIFDIIYLMDISVIYGHLNDSIDLELIKLNNFCIKCNSNFLEQLDLSVSIISMQLSQFASDLGLFDEEDNFNNQPSSYFFNQLDWNIILKLLEQIADTIVPLSFFIIFNSTAAKIYRKHNFESQITKFYHKLPQLKLNLEERFFQKVNEEKEKIKRLVNIIRSSFINTFRYILRHCCLDQLLNKRIASTEKTILIDEFFYLSLTAASSQCFSIDYFAKYSIENDISFLVENAKVTSFENVDSARIDYLLNVIEESRSDCFKNQILTKCEDKKNDCSVSNNHQPLKKSELNSKFNTIKLEPVERVKLNSLISNVQDLFPDLEDELVKKYLFHFDHDPEKVIDAILANKLPESFKTN